MNTNVPNPGEVGKDDRLKVAAEEDHDALISLNEGSETNGEDGEKQRDIHVASETANGWTEKDLEKSIESGRTISSGRNTPNGHADVDIEKQDVIDSSKTSAKEETSETIEPHDPNVVDWDGPNDPLNPMNWSATRRWGMLAVVSGITFLTPLGSSMFAPGVPLVMQDFHSTNELLAGFVVSVYVLGFAFGPLGTPRTKSLLSFWGKGEKTVTNTMQSSRHFRKCGVVIHCIIVAIACSSSSTSRARSAVI